MIDTHTHIYLKENFGDEIPDIIRRAREEGVKHFILPNIDDKSIPELKSLHEKYPDLTSMAIGLHPTEVTGDPAFFTDILKKELSSGNYVAVGEVGMDLYWDKTYREMQLKAFEMQLRIAEEFSKPVIIHCREALQETLEVIKKVSPTIPLIFHSFTGSPEEVKKIRNICNPYFGINGVVTYKNAQSLRDALSEISLSRILLETDAPYLSPVPHRGKRNEPSYLAHIRDKIAETLHKSIEEVEETTDKTASEVFSIKL